MAIQSQPSRIPEPFAGSGTKNTIPATNATPSASQAASWASGFPPECSQPISAGGCPVPRNDVNGALNQLSQDFAFRQDGGIWEWSALADYDAQRMVRGSDGILYWSVQQSGPNLASGAVDPTTDDGTYWTSPRVKTVDVTDSSNAAASTDWVGTKIDDWYQNNLAKTEYYLATDGSDDNDGETSQTAMKTWSALRNKILSSIFIPNTEINIYCAAGTYDYPLSVFGAEHYRFVGPDSGVATFSQMQFQESASIRLYGRLGSKGFIYVNRSATLQLEGYLEFNNVNSTSAFDVFLNGVVSISNSSGTAKTINFVGTSTFTAGTVYCRDGGKFINVNANLSFTGTTPNASRYKVINSSGIGGMGSTTKIPGTSNGYVDSTSYYN